MRRFRLHRAFGVLALSLAAVFASLVPASALAPGAVLDQSYEPTGCQASGINGTFAQTFTAGAGGLLTDVRLGLISASGFPLPAPFDVQIVSVANGLPATSTVLAATGPFDQSTLPSFAPGPSYPWTEF